jgi:hypothetical protein
MFMYAIHDAPIKPLPDNPISPCLATQWSESADSISLSLEHTHVMFWEMGCVPQEVSHG